MAITEDITHHGEKRSTDLKATIVDNQATGETIYWKNGVRQTLISADGIFVTVPGVDVVTEPK